MLTNSIDGATVLITGGTGSFGNALTEHLLTSFTPEKVIIFSRDESKQYEMQQHFSYMDQSNVLRYFIGDVRDKGRLLLALRSGVDIVIHAAALKHVPALEYNPFEAVKTNIIGAQNVIEAALESGVRKVITLSTDKAAAPINLYGATKLASDKLFVSANHYSGPGDHNCRFSVVRYGNVMGSRGSVIPFFLAERNKGVLLLTDKKMTRFSITLTEGVKFVIERLETMLGGEIFVPRIPSYRLIDLANAIAPDAEKRLVGLRPGEKLHEEMITKSDAVNSAEFSDSFVIMPNSEFPWYGSRERYLNRANELPGTMCPENFKYSSDLNSHFLSIEELRTLIAHNVPGGEYLIAKD